MVPIPARTSSLALVLFGITALAACRQPHRALRVGNDAATLKVTLDNLQPTDVNRNDFVYELSRCTNGSTQLPDIDGVLAKSSGLADGTSAPVVSFTQVGLGPTVQGCQVKVKSLTPSTDVTFTSEANVLYWTQYLNLTEDQTGALVAHAALVQQYAPKVANPSQAYTLSIPVQFPGAEAGKTITGGLKCEPLLGIPGTYRSTGQTGGVITFAMAVTQATTYNCSALIINVDGLLQKYHAQLASDVGTIKATPGGAATTATVNLVTQDGTGTGTAPGTATSVVVTTTGATCADNQTWDETKNACVP